MIRIWVTALLLMGLVSAGAVASPASADNATGNQEFRDIQKQVETLRGLKFAYPVPVRNISAKELRAISDREFDKEFPGSKLRSYSDLLAWLDLVPPNTNLKSAYGDFLVGQVAGLYDSDTKEMYIPTFVTGATNVGKKTAEKKLDGIDLNGIVLAHEFTHALEDQYWPMDDPKDHDREASTDRSTAHSFVAEGSASREMIEVIPAQWGRGSPPAYFLLWNLLHSGVGEAVLKHEFGRAWKGADTLVGGVPEALARNEAMPYSFGYAFCAQVMRDWGLDGLDYMYNHLPVSSEQVMHPKKAWEWRDLPVQIVVPETLLGGWKLISRDCVGEAGMAVLFGCQLKNLNRGLELARGWDGDHVALFEGPDGHRVLLWASSWDSTNAAGRYATAWLKERQAVHKAAVKQPGDRIEWQSPEGRVGFLMRTGKRVIVAESDSPEGLRDAEQSLGEITFGEPPEDAARAAANSVLCRYNPVWSRQVDGDYAVSRSLGGLLSRHDRNAVGKADRFLIGILGESRRTASFHRWEVGGGLVAWHESEARRGISQTTWLPWGLLAAHSSARLPQSPDKTIKRTSVLWGIGATTTKDGAGVQSVRVLPFGLLVAEQSGPGKSSFHVLGTGYSKCETGSNGGSTARFRILGIPIWTSHKGSQKNSTR